MYFMDEDGVFFGRCGWFLEIYPIFKSISARFCEKIGDIPRKSKINGDFFIFECPFREIK
jgi:hypothetical protein